jgi:tungstate transport system permease protein
MLEGFQEAVRLLVTFDPDVVDITLRTMQVSCTATLVSILIGIPFGTFLALTRFPGRGLLVSLVNFGMGLPPVVVGLLVYLLLSRAGPLGQYGLLFTPSAMIIAQTVIITPIVAALARQVIEDAWRECREQLRSLGATPAGAALTLLWDARFSLFTAVLAGFGRAAAEVGAVMIVGGNIDGVTRVMTTTIALETSKGDLALALALGLILIGLVLLLNAGVHVTRQWAARRYG